jgi:hypothetical protein
MMRRLSTLERLRSALSLGAMLVILACGVPTTAPGTQGAPRARVLGVLQLEAAVPTSSARPPSDAEEWTPTINDRSRLILPPRVVEVADTVRSGRSFRIVIRTIGLDGCWSADSGSLDERGDTIEIQPFDRHSGAAACTTVVFQEGLEHPFSASFEAPGEGIIRVRGRRVRQDDRNFDLPVMVERKVVIVP